MGTQLSDLVIREIRAVNRIVHPANARHRRQNRPSCALAFKLSGRSSYRAASGEAYLSDPTRVVFLPKGLDYAVEVAGPGVCVMVEFDAAAPVGEPMSVGPVDPQEIAELADALEYSWAAGKPGARHHCMALLYEWMAKYEKRETVYTNSGQQRLLAPAVEAMQKDYGTEQLSNDALAKLAGISTVYFRKLFTRVYGVSPQKYLLRLRVGKAKELLLSDYATLEEIARACGFSSVYYFCRMFRQEAGMTPTEYAQRESFARLFKGGQGPG